MAELVRGIPVTWRPSDGLITWSEKRSMFSTSTALCASLQEVLLVSKVFGICTLRITITNSAKITKQIRSRANKAN
ncbi:hypothetical protein KIN20_013408 [Parelaphostrongylus tenuis]|uniref:Uncharacterized protein n=1 Tax=Parelaphostrongylus tenuis TaxID=148309 RepID=A0AAD5MC16_PARTN|nr:hypothetical protein KIN20_013408 [Parelaphostrongylus tenuis]